MARPLLPSFRLAHLSDPHLPPPRPASLSSLAGKRLLSRIAWARKKKRRHLPEILAEVAADVAAQGCDHTAITGDLTNFSTPEEYAAARVWLESLGPPDSVTVSPGNHDALVGKPEPERFAPWAPWLGDGAELAFPHVRVRGGVALVNLCSAVPTALHLAQGELGAAQLSRLDAALADLEARGLFRVVLLHHPAARGTISRRKALRDQPALADVLTRRGCELVLHGHAHLAVINGLAGPRGRIPVLGVPSASATGAGHDDRARWHLLDIDTAARTVRVSARGLGADGVMAPLGSYCLAG